ncbi:UNVERIFIED_CONTAM: hypothetical protein FKN15_014089 [Acipenser sinensis]
MTTKCYLCGEWGHFAINCPLPPEERLLVPPPPPTAEKEDRLCPSTPAEGAYLLVPPLLSEGEDPLPPSPPGGEEQELPLPPSLLPEGEEQELPLPSPLEGPGQDAGGSQQPLHRLLRGARGWKTTWPLRLRRGLTALLCFAWGRCRSYIAAGNCVAGAPNRGAAGHEEGGGEGPPTMAAPMDTLLPLFSLWEIVCG